MATATMFPDLALGWAGKMADTLDSGKIEELTSDEASAAIMACHTLRDLFATFRRSVEEELTQGVDAKAFAAKYEFLVTDLETISTASQRINGINGDKCAGWPWESPPRAPTDPDVPN